jgi:hypothetical protein
MKRGRKPAAGRHRDRGLRYQMRLAHALHCLPTNSYGHATRELDAIGRMVGGWQRSGAV